MDRRGRGRTENLLELCSTVTTLILEDRHLRLPESNIAKPDPIFNHIRACLCSTHSPQRSCPHRRGEVKTKIGFVFRQMAIGDRCDGEDWVCFPAIFKLSCSFYTRYWLCFSENLPRFASFSARGGCGAYWPSTCHHYPLGDFLLHRCADDGLRDLWFNFPRSVIAEESLTHGGHKEDLMENAVRRHAALPAPPPCSRC